MKNELRPLWHRYFTFNWTFGLFLLLIVCFPRFLLVLAANASGNYGAIGAVMVFSALCPFIFLTRSGRQTIGMRSPKRYRGLLLGVLTGLAFSLLLYYLGQSLYADTDHNWYTYIGKSYKIPKNINPHDKAVMFTIVALTGMLFSPIGEELFFRGMVHASFARSLGDRQASIVDSAAFALTHLPHFGLVFTGATWQFLPVPALLWVLSMFLVSLLFIAIKWYSGSLWGAILCHAAFNLGMTYSIFYLL